jgi:hypothetical protein
MGPDSPTKVEKYSDGTLTTWAYSRSGGQKTVTMDRGAGTTTFPEGTSTI